LAALFLEDEDARAAILLDNHGADGGAVDEGGADVDALAIAAEEDLRELDFLAGLATELLDCESGAWADSVLLAAGSDHRIRHGLSREGRGPLPGMGGMSTRRPAPCGGMFGPGGGGACGVQVLGGCAGFAYTSWRRSRGPGP